MIASGWGYDVWSLLLGFGAGLACGFLLNEAGARIAQPIGRAHLWRWGDILILTRCLSGKAARVHRPSRRRGGHLAARYFGVWP
jgi:hypothetical protein